MMWSFTFLKSNMYFTGVFLLLNKGGRVHLYYGHCISVFIFIFFWKTYKGCEMILYYHMYVRRMKEIQCVVFGRTFFFSILLFYPTSNILYYLNLFLGGDFSTYYYYECLVLCALVNCCLSNSLF